MMMRYIQYMIGCIFLTACSAAPPPQSEYNENKAIVVLTYDDTMNSHLDVAIPQLEKAGLRGTFYISAAGGDLKARIDDWRQVARNGHELGNHTLFHPCLKSKADRDWVQPFYAMEDYTLFQFEEEIRIGNILLTAIDGRNNRSFAYTCGDIEVENGQSVIEVLKRHVSAARTVEPGYENPKEFDQFQIKTIDGAGKSGAQLIAAAEKAKEAQSLVTFLFHGLDASEHLVTSPEAHQALVTYLKENEDDFWVAPLQDVVDQLNP